jgi:hypothetical protein
MNLIAECYNIGVVYDLFLYSLPVLEAPRLRSQLKQTVVKKINKLLYLNIRGYIHLLADDYKGHASASGGLWGPIYSSVKAHVSDLCPPAPVYSSMMCHRRM